MSTAWLLLAIATIIGFALAHWVIARSLDFPDHPQGRCPWSVIGGALASQFLIRALEVR